MTDVSGTLERILSEFSSEEALLKEKLEILQSKRSEVEGTRGAGILLKLDTLGDVVRTKENALRRNKALRREMTIFMGRLRSKKCYNPAEDNLTRMIEKYSEILSKEK